MTFVLDASVTLAWAFEDEATSETDAVLRALNTNDAVVPSIWPYEVGNVLVMAGRSGRQTAADTARFLVLLRGLPITVVETSSDLLWGEASVLVHDHKLSVYDAAYLALAMRRGLLLATKDSALSKAALKAGVRLFEPGV